jgi:hypothetical protein
MKRGLLLIVVVLALLVEANTTRACEPCFEILSLEESAAKADLVIVGRRKEDGPSTGEFPNGGPDWYDVYVVETWKGKAEDDVIRVNGWDGMCLFGFDFQSDDPPGSTRYVMFLQESEDIYYPVEYGCSVKQLIIEGQQAKFDESSVNLDDLANQLGLTRTREADVVEQPPTAEPTSAPALPCIGNIGLLFGIAVVLKKRR